jgi:hypothetical protein
MAALEWFLYAWSAFAFLTAVGLCGMAAKPTPKPRRRIVRNQEEQIWTL